MIRRIFPAEGRGVRERPEPSAFYRPEICLERKFVKCLVIRQIIANFAALNSALMRRSVAKSLKIKAMGGFVGMWSNPMFDTKNEK